MRLPAPIPLIALGLVALTAIAQPHDWPALARLKPGASIVVYTNTATGDARCILLRVDASALTCSPADSPVTRFTYPAARIDEVYQIKRSHLTFGILLALALTGTLIGGLIAASPEAIGVAVFGLILGLIATVPPPPFWGVYGPPPPPHPHTDHMVLVYRSAATP